MMVVSVETEPGFTAGKPRPLFEGRYEEFIFGIQPNYDVSPDGEGFLMVVRDYLSDAERSRHQIRVVVDWFDDLERLVPREN